MNLQFKIKPYEWQLKAISMAETKPDIALLAEMGTGKTSASINILRLWYTKEQRLMRTLILSPLVTLFNWKNEFKLHSTIDERNVVVLGKGTGKKKAHDVFTLTKDAKGGNTTARIFIANYEALLSEDLCEVLQGWAPEILVCDESHLCKNPTSKRTKKVMALADKAKHRIIMTGTPILNSVQDIYSQFRILDGGETFGKNFFVFRSIYMEDENAAWSNKTGHFPRYVARAESYEELTQKIYSKAIRVLKSECLDLPLLVKMVEQVELSPTQRKHYEEMKRDFLTFIESDKVKGLASAAIAQVAVTKALRLQQIITGYVTTEDDVEIALDGPNPRLTRVEELLEELTPNHKVILWCSFKYNYKQLGELCTKLGIKHCFLTGEQNLSEKEQAMQAFNTELDMCVIIANRRAGGIGVNLIAASYSIVYSRNFSLAEELQSEARNYRGGSEIHEQIVKIDLVAMDTIDEHVLEALGNKQQISDDVIDIVKRS